MHHFEIDPKNIINDTEYKDIILTIFKIENYLYSNFPEKKISIKSQSFQKYKECLILKNLKQNINWNIFSKLMPKHTLLDLKILSTY